jgi:hypothetical protein
VIEQDYIMRMIKMLTAAILKLLRLKGAHDFPQALLELQSASKSILGVPLSLLNGLSEEDLLNLYRPDLSTSAAKLHVAGTLLKEEADLFFLQGQTEEAFTISAKAMSLLLVSLQSIGEPLDERHLNSIESLHDRLAGRSLSATLREQLATHFEWKGMFGKAEDLLYELMKEDDRFVFKVVEFYERLLQKTDDLLTRGNLPRDEVQEGLRRAKDRLRFVKVRHS